MDINQSLSNCRKNCYRHNKEFFKTKVMKRMLQIGPENWTIRPLLTLDCSNKVICELKGMWINILKCDLNTKFPTLNDKKAEKQAKFSRRTVEEKRYYCNICGKAFDCNSKLKRHKSTLIHSNKFFNSLD